MSERSAVPLPVEPAARPARRLRRRRVGRGAAPYLLLLPALAVIGAVLGYPLFKLVTLSFQDYGLFELIAGEGSWIGFDNYAEIVGDRRFWIVLLRTVAFTAVTVGLTMVLGTLLALLLARLGKAMRLLITTGLVLVWAMPPVVSVNIWSWMVDYEFGVLNWTLSHLGLEYFDRHDWFVNPIEGFAVITAIVVWGAIPFVTITVYAGLTQLSAEIVEAAEIDGAGFWVTFRKIVLPAIWPVLAIAVLIRALDLFRLFDIIWALTGGGPGTMTETISIYAYMHGFRQFETSYAAAMAFAILVIVNLLVVLALRRVAIAR